jgi:hypothetical protein
MYYSISYGGYNKHGLYFRSCLTKQELRKIWDNLTRWQKLTADIWTPGARKAKSRRLHTILGLTWEQVA